MLHFKTQQTLLLCSLMLIMTACTGGSFDSNVSFVAETLSCETPSSSAKFGVNPGPVILFPTADTVVGNKVTVTGTCVSGIPVEIHEANQKVAEVECKTGSFSSELKLSGGDGSKDLAVYQKTGSDGTNIADRLCFTKDTTPPVVNITDGNNSQSSNATRRPVSGSCEAGLPVIIAGPGLVNSVVTDCVNGRFDVVVDVKQGDGAKDLTATQVDRAGNQGSDGTSVNMDTTPPRVLITSQVPSITNQSSIVVSGVCEAGLPVEIGELRSNIAKAADCPSGTFTATIPLLGNDGPVAARVYQIDNAGNLGFDSRSLIKDTIAPTVTIAAPAANSYINTTTTFSGACESGLSVSLSGSVLPNAQTVSCTSGKWTLSSAITSGQGVKTLVAAQTDAAGNTGKAEANFQVDTMAPAIAITSPAANSYVGSSFTVGGTCETGLTVQIAGNGILPSTSTSCANGAFSATVSASALDGTKQVVATQTDAAGNVGTSTRNFIRDTLGPLLTIDAPAENSTVMSGLTLTGKCEPGLTVNFSGGITAATSLTCPSGGTYSLSVTLTSPDGAKAITANETDAAGNTSTVTKNYIRDATAPVVKITSPAVGTTAQSSLTVGGTCEAGLNVILSGAGVASNVSTACSAQGTFSAAINFSAGSGAKTVKATQTDAVGNVGSDTRDFMSDMTPPKVTITSPVAGSYIPAAITVSGACETGFAVTVAGSGVASAVTTACNNGAYSANVNVTSGDGTKNVTASQTDSANNTASASANYLRDTTPPALTITSPANGTIAQSGVTLVGTCEAGLTVNFGGAGVSAPSSVTCASNGTYQASISFSSGDSSKTIEVSETDAAGNRSQVNGVYNRDSTAPVVAITSPAVGTTAQNGLTIGGTCEAGLDVNLSGSGLASNTKVPCASNGTFTANIDFSAGSGTKQVTASQTDAAGNTGSNSRSFNRDNTVPAITIASPAANSYVPASITVTGSCETGLQVVVAGAGIATGASVDCVSGSYSANVTVSSGDGTKTITAQQTDLAGNVGQASRNVLRDSVGPNVTITSPTPGSSVAPSATIAGACETGLAVSITGDLTSASGACNNGAYSISVTFSSGLGTKNVLVKQTDAAGNVGQASAQYLRDSNLNSETFISDASFGKIDILFIDDNSASMDPKQASLGTKFSGFSSELKNIDWQIGITTTDCSTGPYGICGSLLSLTGTGSKILKPSTANYETVFNNSIQRPETAGCLNTGTCPAGASEPLLSATTAMSKHNSDNSGFFRQDSDLAIVILSDADERQTGGATYANRPQELVNNFNTIWPNGKKLKVYSIIVQPGDQACLDAMKAGSNGFSFYGELVDKTVQLTSGLSTSICAPDYSVTLKSIGESVRTLTNSVELAHTPIAGSVTVTFTPNQAIGYKVIGNRVVFDSPPSVGTEIKVDYKY